MPTFLRIQLLGAWKQRSMNLPLLLLEGEPQKSASFASVRDYMCSRRIASLQRLGNFNYVARRRSSPTSWTPSPDLFDGNFHFRPPIIWEAKFSPFFSISMYLQCRWECFLIPSSFIYTAASLIRSKGCMSPVHPRRWLHAAIRLNLRGRRDITLLHSLISVSLLFICVFATSFYQQAPSVSPDLAELNL